MYAWRSQLQIFQTNEVCTYIMYLQVRDVPDIRNPHPKKIGADVTSASALFGMRMWCGCVLRMWKKYNNIYKILADSLSFFFVKVFDFFFTIWRNFFACFFFKFWRQKNRQASRWQNNWEIIGKNLIREGNTQSTNIRIRCVCSGVSSSIKNEHPEHPYQTLKIPCPEKGSQKLFENEEVYKVWVGYQVQVDPFNSKRKSEPTEE